MSQWTRTYRGGGVDVVTVPDSLDMGYQRDEAWSRIVDPAEAERLKGEKLDQALRDAGLPLTGTADEKRERLANPGSEQD
jgi:hypothetical protein